MKDLFNMAGPSMYPLLIISAVIIVLTLLNGRRLVQCHSCSLPRIGTSINAILFWGVVAAVIGFLGQWNGIYLGMLEMANYGLSSWQALWTGIAESCLPTISGVGILLVAGLLWFGLKSCQRWLMAAAPPAGGDSAGANEAPVSAGELARPVWQRVMLALVVTGLPVVMVVILIGGRYFVYGSRFIWLVAGVAAVALVIALAKTTTLCFRTTIDPLRQRRGLATMIFLAVTSFGLGLYGLIIELFIAARLIAADLEGINLYSARALVGSSATLVVSMGMAITISIIWYMLRSAAQRIERAEAVPT
jgi:hypothetical protein